ncbi:MAG: type II toxin-antitoxin system RelE/ParE family toxin [Spirochaetales bacterium]|nr:type II toxin-antitoxin system RelE/ParE family toxin [Spirochaetales bacterium]
MSASFRLAETATYRKSLDKLKNLSLEQRIREIVYPEIVKSPLAGPNIKKLKGQYDLLYRFRIGDYRIFYLVDTTAKIIFLTEIHHRKDAYKRKK